jgi:hypothetical protein
VRVEAKRMYYSVDNDDDYDPKVCVRARGCVYGHRSPRMRLVCRGWWSVTRRHMVAMVFWTPKDDAFSLSRRILYLVHILLLALLGTSAVGLGTRSRPKRRALTPGVAQ